MRMPIEFRYDREKEILHLVMESPLTLEEVRAAMKDVTSSDEFSPDVGTMWDLRALDFSHVDRAFEESVIEIRKRFPERGGARIALIVADELGFGMTRMYQILSELSGELPQETKVFRNYAAGEDWLLGPPG